VKRMSWSSSSRTPEERMYGQISDDLEVLERSEPISSDCQDVDGQANI
jgi:hypothetical protein